MKFLTNKELNIEKFDALVSKDAKNNVFCYSWYLSATCDSWGAIVDDEYTFALPIPYKNRILFKQGFQHPFSRDLDFFGNELLLPQGIELLKSFYKFRIHFQGDLPFSSTKRVFQRLSLTEEIKYKKNTQRILAKNSGKYQFKFSENYQFVLQFYFENSFHKIKQQAKNKIFLTKLMQQAISNHAGECLEVWENNVCIAAAFFLKEKETVCYLIGDSYSTHKKEGVMFSLMDEAIKHYQSTFKVFDFGGSNIDSVATFYRKMGGVDAYYYEYIK